MPLHFLIFISTLISSSSSLPLLTPITKDHNSLQYTVTILQRTPLQPTKLVLDLGASFSWSDCQNHYNSTNYKLIPCNSTLCTSLNSLACSNCYQPPSPGCGNDTCSLFPENSISLKTTVAAAIIDAIALPTTDGKNPGKLDVIPNFISSCSRTFVLKDTAKGVTGFAALGRSNFSLPAQIAAAFSSPYLFAICLSGSPSAPGVAFFGTAGPYYFLPEIDLSKSLIYTPLILNPIVSTIIFYNGVASDEYYIGVTAVKVNGKLIVLNKTLLAVDQTTGGGGTKISTVYPYTALERSIYKAFVAAFITESAAMNLTVTNPVKPFRVCYAADDVISTQMGPAVPTVDFVMHRDDVFWRMFGANSMVRIVKKGIDVWCLGFVDGGVNARTSIVIGGHQMEDILLQFDLKLKRFGFTSSVLAKQTMCANFNFTTNNKIM